MPQTGSAGDAERPSRAIRVLIADDHAVVRAGLRRILELEGDLQVVGEAADGAQALEMALRARPDVVLMDISMPQLNGLEATRHLRERLPSARVVALTIHADDEYLVEMCRAGAWGYVVKDADPGAVVEAIRAVASGQVYVPPALVGGLVRALRQLGPRPGGAGVGATGASEVAASAAPGAGREGGSCWPRLTDREAEVLGLIAQGKNNRQIAQALVVSEKTVKNHVTSILRKLGVKDRTQAAVWALRSGWAPWP